MGQIPKHFSYNFHQSALQVKSALCMECRQKPAPENWRSAEFTPAQGRGPCAPKAPGSACRCSWLTCEWGARTPGFTSAAPFKSQLNRPKNTTGIYLVSTCFLKSSHLYLHLYNCYTWHKTVTQNCGKAVHLLTTTLLMLTALPNPLQLEKGRSLRWNSHSTLRGKQLLGTTCSETWVNNYLRPWFFGQYMHRFTCNYPEKWKNKW